MSTYFCGLHLHDFLPKLEAVILIDDDRAREGHIIIIYNTALCSMALKLFNTCLKFLLCADNFLINLTWWSSWSNPLCLAKFLQKWNQFLPKKYYYYLVKKLAVDKKICESKSQIELLNLDDLIVVVYTYSKYYSYQLAGSTPIYPTPYCRPSAHFETSKKSIICCTRHSHLDTHTHTQCSKGETKNP